MNGQLVFCDRRDCSTDLWFLEDEGVPVWTKRYTIRHMGCICPVMVFGDGRILVESNEGLRAYDPQTGTWADLTTVNGDFVGVLHESLLCSSVGG
jgi:hypothetical protein